MTTANEIPKDIADAEELGRELFSRSHARTRIPVYAFEKAEGNEGISVDRMDFADEQTMARIGKKNAKKRPPREDRKTPTFRGWAILTAEKATEERRTVRYSPENDNRYHSDIILPKKDNPKTHAQNLADASKLKRYVCQKREATAQS